MESYWNLIDIIHLSMLIKFTTVLAIIVFSALIFRQFKPLQVRQNLNNYYHPIKKLFFWYSLNLL